MLLGLLFPFQLLRGLSCALNGIIFVCDSQQSNKKLLILCRFVLEKASHLSSFIYICSLSPSEVDQETKYGKKLKFSSAGLPRSPNERGQWKSPYSHWSTSHHSQNFQRKTHGKQRPLKGAFHSKFQGPAPTLGIVKQRASPGQPVWWVAVKVWLCTASQNGTQNEADFVEHPTPQQQHWTRLWDPWRGTSFPWPTGHHGGRRCVTASSIKSGLWLLLLSTELFVRNTAPFNVLSVPQEPRTPHQSPWGYQP